MNKIPELDKLIKDVKDKRKLERLLSILVLFIIGISLIFNTLVPMFAVFLIFYYDANKDKITKIR